MKDLECPYCEQELEINHDDGFGYDENEKHQMQCEHCDKHFVFETEISFYYYPEKADCLNDGKHSWKKTNHYPVEFSVMECTMCDEKRDLTDEERKEYNIGTKKEYYEKIKDYQNLNN